jgi:putative restriction endonuclease
LADCACELFGQGKEVKMARGADKYLNPIQDVCLTKFYPPLTGLVVSKNRPYLPRSGFKDEKDKYDELLQKAIDFRWDDSAIHNPFAELASAGVGEKQVAKSLLKPPYGKSKLGASVEGRGNRQRVFRTALLEAYNGKCSFCGIDEASILEAAHLQPYVNSTPEEQMSVHNGILLCRNHHRLFDRHLLRLSENGVLFASQKIANAKKGYLMKLGGDIHSGVLKFHQPEIVGLRPSKYFIKRHKK